MIKPILEIQGLTVEFPGVTAVDDLHLSIEEGSFASIVGESGSGKSVTALSICRLIPPSRSTGKILWHGSGPSIDLLNMPEKSLRQVRGGQIAYVFQDPSSSFNPVLKIGDQIAETYLAHFDGTARDAKAVASRQLETVRIKDVERVYDSFPHELSGGMKQRAMIAMALVGQPKLLIADEPTTALDVTIEFEILQLLASLQKEKGLTLLFITHNLRLAAKYSSVIHVMKKGKLVDGKDPYTKKLFSAALDGQTPKTLIKV